MGSRELTEWAAWEEVHGRLGPERWDYLAALICQTIAEGNRDPKSKSDSWKLSDFLLWKMPGAGESPGDITTAEGMADWIRALKAEQDRLKE